MCKTDSFSSVFVPAQVFGRVPSSGCVLGCIYAETENTLWVRDSFHTYTQLNRCERSQVRLSEHCSTKGVKFSSVNKKVNDDVNNGLFSDETFYILSCF